MGRYSRERKAKAIERELGFRRRVFRGSVARGDMTESEAREEIAIFEAIAADYAPPDLLRESELVTKIARLMWQHGPAKNPPERATGGSGEGGPPTISIADLEEAARLVIRAVRDEAT